MRRRKSLGKGADESKYKNNTSFPRPNKPEPMISNAVLIGIVVFLFFLGYLQHYYLISRAKDPFGQVSTSSFTDISKKSLLSPQEDASLERDADGTRYHVIFSTDCSPYQHWQSYLVFYTAMKVRQPGTVTRIASGCNFQGAAAMQEWFDQDIRFLSRRFHLQLTPPFSGVTNEKGEMIGDYKFFNKPFGMKYWMEHSPLLGFDNGRLREGVEDDIVVLIDPDMGLLRPLTKDFSVQRETVIAENRKDHILATKVGPGKPFAQVYGFGAQWQRLDLNKIAGEGSPAVNVSLADGRLYYPVGPPYLATCKDMYSIAIKWTEFVPRVYEQYPHLLAEMFAFCIAAAHLELPFQLINSLMVSDAEVTSEGWPLVDKIPANEVCRFAKQPDHSKYAVPNVVHLCQRYSVGKEWFFSKRRIPSDMYECGEALFQEPPDNIATAYDYKWPPGGHKTEMSSQMIGRHAFMLCFLYSLLNEAALFYKENKCDPVVINRSKSRNLAAIMTHQKISHEDASVEQ